MFTLREEERPTENLDLFEPKKNNLDMKKDNLYKHEIIKTTVPVPVGGKSKKKKKTKRKRSKKRRS